MPPPEPCSSSSLILLDNDNYPTTSSRRWRELRNPSSPPRTLPFFLTILIIFTVISSSSASATSGARREDDLLTAITLPPEQVRMRMDRIMEALMVESLRNNLVQACDNEKITLHCPRNTHILIQTTFYGRLVPSRELCPSQPNAQLESNGSLVRYRNEEWVDDSGRRPDSIAYEDTSCDFSEAHNKVTELCRNKRKCRIVVKASFFGDRDPCAKTSKYLQISYKCKPISFEDQNFCEGINMQLSCKPNKRLSVYSAQYGRTINGQAMHCSSQPEPVTQDCIRDVLPELLKACHAQTECSIGVNDHYLGNPCASGVQKYLSLIYMCVNDEVFSDAALKGEMDSMDELEQELDTKRKQSPELFESISEGTHHQRRHHDQLEEKSAADVQKSTLSADYGIEDDAIDNKAGSGKNEEDRKLLAYAGNGLLNGEHGQGKADREHLPNAVGVADDFLGFVDFIKENKEKSLLYFFLSAASGVILLLLACIFYQCRARSKEKKHANLLASRNHQTVSVCRLPQARSGAELSSLIGSSNQTSPFGADMIGGGNLAEYCGVGSGRIYDSSFQTQQQIYSSGSSHSSGGRTIRGGTTRSGGSTLGGGGYQWGGTNMTGSGNYTRFSQVTPPRIPPTLHYYS